MNILVFLKREKKRISKGDGAHNFVGEGVVDKAVSTLAEIGRVNKPSLYYASKIINLPSLALLNHLSDFIQTID